MSHLHYPFARHFSLTIVLTKSNSLVTDESSPGVSVWLSTTWHVAFTLPSCWGSFWWVILFCLFQFWVISITFVFMSDWSPEMPVPYPPPNVGAYTRTPSHNQPCSAVEEHIIFTWVFLKFCLFPWIMVFAKSNFPGTKFASFRV